MTDRARSRRRDTVVIGASAGGLPALESVVGGLVRDVPACILVVVHTSVESDATLPRLLSHRTSLDVRQALDNAPLEYGRIYVAPPDRHLLVGQDRIRVSHGPKENGFRPAVDPLFESAAHAHGKHTIGVVLSGSLDDGTLGLAEIKRCGGVAIVQSPEEASFPSMPLSAIREVAVDHVVSASEIGRLIDHFARHPGADPGGRAMEEHEEELVPVALTCTECGGAMWEVRNGRPPLRFRCHVGHSLTGESLLRGQHASVEAALWAAYRALKEHHALHKRMAARARDASLLTIADQYETKAREAEERIRIIGAVLNSTPLSHDDPAARAMAIEGLPKGEPET